MVEGCGGGWPHFDAYFFEHAHMVGESCAPYSATTKGLKCSNFASCPPLAKIKKTEFVGNGFAQVTEKQMMKDILRNGPTSVEFQANQVFGAYKNGILSEKGLIGVKQAVSQLDNSKMTLQQKLVQKTLTHKLEALIAQLQGAGVDTAGVDINNVLSQITNGPTDT